MVVTLVEHGRLGSFLKGHLMLGNKGGFASAMGPAVHRNSGEEGPLSLSPRPPPLQLGSTGWARQEHGTTSTRKCRQIWLKTLQLAPNKSSKMIVISEGKMVSVFLFGAHLLVSVSVFVLLMHYTGLIQLLSASWFMPNNPFSHTRHGAISQ